MARLSTLKPRLNTIETRRLTPPPKQADPRYLTPEHRAWRTAVCRRAGWRCEWVENGQRCTKRAPHERMIADHVVELKDGGAALDLNNGQCLCTAHNTRKGLAARGAR